MAIEINPKTSLFAEDAAHVSGDPGIMPLAVQDADTASAALAGAAGDYAPLQADSNGRLFVNGVLYSDTGTAVQVQNFVQAAGSTISVPGLVTRSSMNLYNTSTIDPYLNNTTATALASAARTATTSSSDLTNFNAVGVYIFFSITAVPGVHTVTLTVTAKDPIAGTYETLLTGSAESTTATKCYLLYPGAGAAANGVDVVNAFPIPRTWRVTVTHSAGSSFTYSVGIAYIL